MQAPDGNSSSPLVSGAFVWVCPDLDKLQTKAAPEESPPRRGSSGK